MRTSRITGVVLGMLLTFSVIATGLVQANPFSMPNGGQLRGTASIEQNINGTTYLLVEDNRFGATLSVQGVQAGRFGLAVSGEGDVAGGATVPRNSCVMPLRLKEPAQVNSNDSVSTNCITFSAYRLGTATVTGTYIWSDTMTGIITTFSITGTA